MNPPPGSTVRDDFVDGALQTASIVAGLPMAINPMQMEYGMIKTEHEDFPVPNVEDKRELE